MPAGSDDDASLSSKRRIWPSNTGFRRFARRVKDRSTGASSSRSHHFHSAELRPLRYQPLDADGNEIRLFKLDVQPRAGAPSTLITGSMLTFKLGTYPRFRAISYVWGDSMESDPILIDGKLLGVKKNLLDFLLAYRQTVASDSASVGTSWLSAVEYLWIDQLCIDQNNVEERGHQVKLMSRIYRQAQDVCAWLGTDPVAIDTLEHFRIACKKDEKAYGIESFMRLNFWERLWIQQEMVLASHLVFMAGSTFFSARELEKTDHLWTVQREPALLLAMGNTNAGRKHMRLLDAIKRFSAKDCSDPRDRVFALLGMVHSDECIEVNYKLSVGEVFEQTIRAVFRNIGFPFDLMTERQIDMTDLVGLGARMGINYSEALQTYLEIRSTLVRRKTLIRANASPLLQPVEQQTTPPSLPSLSSHLSSKIRGDNVFPVALAAENDVIRAASPSIYIDTPRRHGVLTSPSSRVLPAPLSAQLVSNEMGSSEKEPLTSPLQNKAGTSLFHLEARYGWMRHRSLLIIAVLILVASWYATTKVLG